jgi:transcriptional regulator with XRE-family HTH domain
VNDKTKKKTLAAFGTNLRAARGRSGWTQAQLAEKLGISVAYLSLLERGGRNPPMTTVVELMRHLDASPGQILPAEAA